ncbi:hypothetical protein [Cellulomonas xylanilytica]|uniref:Polyketide cyclase / dehydrase and lipid transport n=1 Tax=Cellulomonas xylanilytica TaxID=233583 RepID=A0A510V990_9CELL|nr:hypothetical protein [Cellulomonas xylanilytica]GEK23433.1 hypothetical protein CXY01_39530 [Cellulomonas xylanilytica]
MTTDIVTSADCPGAPDAVWLSLVAPGRYDESRRTLALDHADVRLRSLTPGLGVRGTARWLGVPYRVNAYLVPVETGTRLLVTARDKGTTPVPSWRRRLSRRLAGRDLRRLVDEASRHAA